MDKPNHSRFPLRCTPLQDQVLPPRENLPGNFWDLPTPRILSWKPLTKNPEFPQHSEAPWFPNGDGPHQTHRQGFGIQHLFEWEKLVQKGPGALVHSCWKSPENECRDDVTEKNYPFTEIPNHQPGPNPKKTNPNFWAGMDSPEIHKPWWAVDIGAAWAGRCGLCNLGPWQRNSEIPMENETMGFRFFVIFSTRVWNDKWIISSELPIFLSPLAQVNTWAANIMLNLGSMAQLPYQARELRVVKTPNFTGKNSRFGIWTTLFVRSCK